MRKLWNSIWIFEYFCQMSSKSILIILSYTVLKFARFLRRSVGSLMWMAGNVACAVHAAAKLGSHAFGMFIKCQNKLHSEPLSSDEVSAFRKALMVWNLYTRMVVFFLFYPV